MFKNNSKTKIILALISLIITFFVWQQGLKDSLERPSVAFDISQKEIEIAELASQSVPKDLKAIITESAKNDMKKSLSRFSYSSLSDRNKLIWLVLNDEIINENLLNQIDNEEYKKFPEIIELNNSKESYEIKQNFIKVFENDLYLYKILSEKYNISNEKIISNKLSQWMFLKIILIRIIPIISILIGSILVLKLSWKSFKEKKINWKDYKPLDLNLIDMVLLISGGFVVLGEVFSPLISITIVELIAKDFPQEILQSLKIFFGYLFMAIPPLFIIYRQIKISNGEFTFKQDYFQFNIKPITASFIHGLKGWFMVIPFVLLTSLLMESLIKNQAGSNPLLEIVLNNNNNIAFSILFLTTTILAPVFEEIIFRGVLLPILSRDFGRIYGILISSFVFALAHLSLSELPPLFILGIGLAATRLISGRLFSSIVMHSLWNGLTFFNLFLLRT
tara:strand:- start:1669 stop:3015 length:1347 start_codon:yes stop_codon:yes gene_type:complete